MKKTYGILVLVFLAAIFSVAALDLTDVAIEATESCGGGVSSNLVSTNHLGQSFIANHTGMIKSAKTNIECVPGLSGNRTFCWDIRNGNWSSNGIKLGSGCSQIECNTTGTFQSIDISANVTKGNKYFIYMSNNSGEWLWRLACPSLYPDIDAFRYDGSKDTLLSYDLQVNFTTSVLDSDGDLIVDEDDSCPAVFGLTQLNGCPDSEKPNITLVGDNPQIIGIDSSYLELGATATDNIDGDLTANISIDSGSINTSLLGNYFVYYSVNDSAGNYETINRSINVVDIAGPIITLIGSNPQQIEYLNSYVELGATATDNVDGNISGNIIVDSSTVNISILGIYNVTYNVNDSNGNNADQKARTVNVVDTTSPVISLTGITPLTIEVGSSYVELGATASDNYDSNLTASIITINPVNESIVGSYLITYNVVDSNNNAALQVSRVVNIVDTTVPVITLTGANPQTIEVHDSYVELGATALDDYDGDLTSNIIINAAAVSTDIVSSYNVTYDISDSNSNEAVQIQRTINIVDTTNPLITLIGNQIVDIEVGSMFIDEGATAIDNYDGDLTGSIVVNAASIDINTIGSYNVTYDVTDSNINSAIQIQRKVNVIDTTIPVITLIGQVIINMSIGDSFSDTGATALDNYDGNITENLVVVNSVNTSIVGQYTITYNIKDTSNNDAIQIERIVNVLNITDITPPEIILSYSIGILYVTTNENAICYYNTTTSNLALINENATITNKIVLNLAYGTYQYYAECFDGSNNKANSTINIVLSAPPVVPPTSNGGGGGGGSSFDGGLSLPEAASNKANIIISEINPGDKKDIKINNKEIAIKEIHIEVNNQVKNIDITIIKETGQPASVTKVTEKANEEVYQYLSINHPNLKNEDIKSAEISFEVDKKWLADKNINGDTISLNRFVDGKWTKLTTYKSVVNIDKILYTAETPGFSVFAIKGESKNVEIPLGNDIENMTNEIIMPAQINETSKNNDESNIDEKIPTKSSNIFFYFGGLMIAIVLVICLVAHFTKGKNKDKNKNED